MSKRIAAIQLNTSSNLKQNLQVIEQLINAAKEKQADLVVLPENAVFMGENEQDKFNYAEEFGVGPIQAFFKDMAKTYNLWIVGGTIPIIAESGNRAFAACIVWDEHGNVKARYDKIHLFDAKVGEEHYNESKTIAPGADIVVIDSPVGKLGLSVCYDIRFPELYRKLTAAGAKILCIPSAFTQKTGQVHWEILCRARAIENLSYVIAPAQVGTHADGRETYGHSLIINPWGKIISALSEGEGVIIADIDINYLEKIRTEFPVLQHQKLNQNDNSH